MWLLDCIKLIKQSWTFATPASTERSKLKGFEPRQFLTQVREMPLESWRSEVELILEHSSLDARGNSIFLLSCLEELCREPTCEAKLAGMLCGLVKDDASQAAAEDPALRQRALSVSLCLWRHNNSQFTALRVLQKWRVAETDAVGQQLDDFRRMVQDVLAHSNWHILLAFLQAFPQFAQTDRKKINKLIDEICDDGLFKVAIQVAKCANLTKRRIGTLYRKLQFHQIETGARTEGKELESIAACGKDRKLQRLFVQKLVRAGKLELAAERITYWRLQGIGLNQTKQGARRARKFLRLPARVKVRMVSSEELEEGVSELRRSVTTCIGFDTESLRGGKPCLLQVATKRRVLLIDLLTLQPNISASVAP